MNQLSYLQNKPFLKSLDNYSNRTYWVRIEVYNLQDRFIRNLQGRVQPGSTISINGSSSVRRTCNITLVAEEADNDLTNIENILSPNKRIKIFEGIKNEIDENYDDIIWFPLGVFVIVQPNISHTGNGCLISLSCKDKMCLLNGECAGILPTSVTFHEYDQIIGRQKLDEDPRTSVDIPNDYTIYQDTTTNKYYSWTQEYGWTEEKDDSSVGETVSRPQRIYDIIQTLVHNYGGESLDKIFINDVPLTLKQLVRYTGDQILYYNENTKQYTLNEMNIANPGEWREFQRGDDVGYVYTDFTYPGSLVTNIGENVASVLEKIKNTLGNYEYFYDVEGNFVFQEIKNYLNNSYEATNVYRLEDDETTKESKRKRRADVSSYGLSILDNLNYEVDYYANSKSAYTFNEDNGLIASYSNSPNFNNIKNDFHIWGETEGSNVIHYHVVIKEKPIMGNKYKVVFLKNDKGEFTGGLRLMVEEENLDGLVNGVDYNNEYEPNDWRAELYLQGLQKQKIQQRPDIYEQELLDLFDSIYDFRRNDFKVNIVANSNNLLYFFDYLTPSNTIYDYSVDVLGTKVYSYQQKKIKKMYTADVPDVILVDLDLDPPSRKTIIDRCNVESQAFANVDHTIYSKIAIGTLGYSAQEVARDLLYQYTNYNETITLTSVPIYYLDVNSRITVQDRKTNIYGDYIIHSITLPLDAGSPMNISASRALERF